MQNPVAPTDGRGTRELRAAVARSLRERHGVEADPDHEILITTGGQEAIFLILQALCGPGDEVLMPSPRYTSYDVAINVCGARVVDVPPPGPLDFSLNLTELEARITDRTRALLLISPGNPTAAVADRVALEGLAELARRRDLLVIYDEIYERILYDGAVHTSLASLPGMRERTITVGGFSKSYAMTGWRVGYLAGPGRLVSEATRLKALWSGPASAITQAGALAALTHPEDLSAPMVATYAARRRIALSALDELGLPHGAAQGAFYVFFDISRHGLSASEFSRRLLLEAGVFLYPGSGFGAEWSTHMRMAWLQPEPRLGEALERLADWLARQPG